MPDRPAAEAWTDARLEAAFVGLVPAEAPSSVGRAVVSRLDDARRPGRRWPGLGSIRLVVAAGVVAVLAVAVVAGSAWLRVGPLGGSMFIVRPGGDGTSVLDAGTFRFSFPSSWTVVDAGAAGSFGSVIAVLGTMPVEPRCGTGHVDVNCVYEQALDPGMIRVFVGTTAFRGTTIFDRPDLETGTTTRLTIAGMPAIRDDISAMDDFYRADLDLRWSIGLPNNVSNAASIEVMARDPGAADARATAEALVASFAFTPPATPVPPGSGPRLARLAIAEMDRSFRAGFGQTTGENHYSCQPETPDSAVNTTIRFSAGGDLGGDVPVTCSWSVVAEGTAYWRLELHVDWTAGGRAGRYTESDWIGADGGLAGSRWTGEGPPLFEVPQGQGGSAATPGG